MSEQKLEERLRALEIRGAAMLASSATLAACCVAFLGFEYYRIPHRVQKELDTLIGTETRQQIDGALAKIERMQGQQAQTMVKRHGDLVNPPDGTKKEDWVALIAPIAIGAHDSKDSPVSEKDDALLAFQTDLDDEGDGWKVTARYCYRYSESDFDSDPSTTAGQKTWQPTTAKVSLIPLLSLPSPD